MTAAPPLLGEGPFAFKPLPLGASEKPLTPNWGLDNFSIPWYILDMKNNHYLTVDEAASRLRYTIWTVYKMIKSGELPARKVGGQWRVSASAIEQKLEPLPFADRPAE